jgi:cytochrome c oxidase subunit 3
MPAVPLWFSRFKFIERHCLLTFHLWVSAPMYYVALMTFFNFSSVTMVVRSSNEKKGCTLCLTIIGGGIFVGSQAWEWKNFIKVSMGY